MSEHLKNCPFYQVERKTDPVLLTGMCESREQTQKTLVSTFKRRVWTTCFPSTMLLSGPLKRRFGNFGVKIVASNSPLDIQNWLLPSCIWNILHLFFACINLVVETSSTAHWYHVFSVYVSVPCLVQHPKESNKDLVWKQHLHSLEGRLLLLYHVPQRSKSS